MIEDFRQAIQATGLNPPIAIVADGVLRRFPTNGRSDDDSGWYVLHGDGIPAGHFGDWRTGIKQTWSAKSFRTMRGAEKAAHRAKLEKIKRQRDEDSKRRQSEAREKAERIWSAARPAPANYPYLQRKSVTPHGLKVHDGALLVPLREGGELYSLQFIDGEGGKKFLSGGRVKGCYHAFGGNPELAGVLCIVEGYATGASVHEATGYPVAVAFNAENLVAVARTMQTKFQAAKIIICADDDYLTDGNPGLTKATAAARAVGGYLAIPDFGPDRPEKATDFNDLAAHIGLAAVKAQVDAALSAPLPNHSEAKEISPQVNLVAQDGECDIPSGWHLDSHGVFWLKESRTPEEQPGRIFVSGPARVVALNRNEQGDNWGLSVRFTDLDDKEKELAIPRGRLHEQGPGLSQDFALVGLRIASGQEGNFKKYLGAFNPKVRRFCTDRLGWTDSLDGGLVFVLPNQVIGPQSAEGVVYQPEHYSPTTTTIRTAGHLEDWKNEVAGPCTGNPFLVFSICCAISGPLLKLSGLDGGGFHLYGRSSHGKTTAAQVAASVWGCGADPAAASERSFIRRWNTTANALEGLAAAHNDLLLILDELGTCTAKDAGAIVYNLAGGQGKGRMNASAALRQQRTWRVLFLSTGEIPILAKIEEDGKTAHAGQLLRCLDIPTETGVITDSLCQTPKDFADKLKRACSTYYGAAGPAFLERLISQMEDFSESKAEIVQLLQNIEPQLTPENETPEQGRAIKRFALVVAAGWLGARLGILPWDETNIFDAVDYVTKQWLVGNRSLSDVDRGVEGVRNFIMRYPNRFQPLGRDEVPPHNRAGFRIDGKYYLFDEAFKEACEGHNEKEVARRLKEMGYLFWDEEGRLKARLPVEVEGNRPRLYTVKASILEGDAYGD